MYLNVKFIVHINIDPQIWRCARSSKLPAALDWFSTVWKQPSFPETREHAQVLVKKIESRGLTFGLASTTYSEFPDLLKSHWNWNLSKWKNCGKIIEFWFSQIYEFWKLWLTTCADEYVFCIYNVYWYRDSKLFTSLWVPGTHRPWSLRVLEHWEWFPPLMFLFVGNFKMTQVVSSCWVSFEF